MSGYHFHADGTVHSHWPHDQAERHEHAHSGPVTIYSLDGEPETAKIDVVPDGRYADPVVKKDPAIIAFEAELRAVTEGHRAFVQPGGSIKVVSDTKPDKSYTVRFFGRPDGVVWFVCDCPSGTNRTHLVLPCKHAAVAARRLVRERIAVLGDDALWHVHPDVQANNTLVDSMVPPMPEDDGSDPFVGLP